jgi:cell division protease FtsH
MALGVTMQTPGEDRHVVTEAQIAGRLEVLMGGYAAERLVLGDGSSGAEDDLKKATELAFRMVAHYGMSERIGPTFIEHRTEHPFLGHVLGSEGGTSDATVRVVEEETAQRLARAVAAATAMLATHRAALDLLIARLLVHETLEREELVALFDSPAAAAAVNGDAANDAGGSKPHAA